MVETDGEASHFDGYYGATEASNSGELDTPRQSGMIRGERIVQYTLQTNFLENADNQVDVASQDDDRSMIVNVGSGSKPDDSTQHSDFSRNSVNSSDEEYGDKLRDLYNFWHLEMVKQMKKWSGDKFKKAVPSVFYSLSLISRALSRDDILKSIMETADHFRDMYLPGAQYESLERAVSKRRSVIRDKLALSAKEPESDDGSDLEFDIC